MLQVQSSKDLNLWQTFHEIAEKSSKIVPLGAPLAPSFSFTYKPPFSPRTLPQRHCHANVTLRTWREGSAKPWTGKPTSFGKDAVARDEWPSFLRVNECERRSGASKRKRAIG